MKTNPLKEGILIENSAGIGTVTRGMVRQRAVELALINGRSAQEASKSDLEQAKRELTDKLDIDPAEAALESAPESGRRDPVPPSTGQIVSGESIGDEDAEGRTVSEKLIEAGVREAEHDQMLQANRAKREEEEW
ncbi:MAG TPA: hypothetical protein VIT91_04890 [Chthoniobacterales bacterium]